MKHIYNDYIYIYLIYDYNLMLGNQVEYNHDLDGSMQSDAQVPSSLGGRHQGCGWCV